MLVGLLCSGEVNEVLGNGLILMGAACFLGVSTAGLVQDARTNTVRTISL